LKFGSYEGQNDLFLRRFNIVFRPVQDRIGAGGTGLEIKFQDKISVGKENIFGFGYAFISKQTKVMVFVTVKDMPARTKTVTSELLFLQIRLHRFDPGGALFPTSFPADGKPLFAIRRDSNGWPNHSAAIPTRYRCKTAGGLSRIFPPSLHCLLLK